MSAAYMAALAVFIATARATAQQLTVAKYVEHKLQEKPATPQPLKREDSIFEETESLGALEPHAVEAAKLQAQQRAHVDAVSQAMGVPAATLSVGEAEPGSEDNQDDDSKAAPAPAGDDGKGGEPETPLSAGEKPPAASTGNKGKTGPKTPRAPRKSAKPKPSN